MPCDVLVDTTGIAFSYPFIKLFCSPSPQIYSYTHYPTVQEGLLKVKMSVVKQLYNRFLIWAYSFCGSFADIVACNSTWTLDHIKSLWSVKQEKLRTIYPPCDTDYFGAWVDKDDDLAEKQTNVSDSTFINKNKGGVPLAKVARKNQVISFAQFRPEKDHKL